MIMTPLVYDPQNFTPRKGVMTRYAKKMVEKQSSMEKSSLLISIRFN